jgi:hypothetical protein
MMLKKAELKIIAAEIAEYLLIAQQNKFLTYGEAASRLGLPESTFRQTYRRLGLTLINLNDAVKEGEPLKNCYRFLASDVEAVAKKAVEARNRRNDSLARIFDPS